MKREMMNTTMGLTIILISIFLLAQDGSAQQDMNVRLEELERQVRTLDAHVKTVELNPETVGQAGLVLFLFGAFCALWAQNTQRNAWLWFFLGLFFHIIPVLILLYKHSSDQRRDEHERRREEKFDQLLTEYQRAIEKIQEKKVSAEPEQ